ncbi:fimbrial biogenesis chaperone [Flavobacterium muglaense]|uniref:Molecular chaperone n=1 Tax=Flavobacterium muglaense TaxID=2764716 RepID=A0A923N2Q2_9FLAO|nr:molecular chaperone [Flavobacterium muglaense]MBC5839733.1 molecular chaperone [Flavobacterium muglaense]MBC5846261.1 molecular chaperone [Flavobacterium muglaense]
MNIEIKFLSLFPHLFRNSVILILYIFFGNSLFAQGNLVVHPKRIVFDGKKKIEKLVLSNTGKDSAVYNISFIEYKMNEDGELLSVKEEEEGLRFASPYVRLYPRIVKLGPNESQILKVQMYNTENIADGEYRSHLYFRAEQEKTALGTAAKAKEALVSVKLEAVFGISIACIIRKGENKTSLSISNMSYSKSKDQENLLLFKLNRAGNMSAYGDFLVSYVAPNNKVYEVGSVKGIGLYLPGSARNMRVKLNAPSNVDFKGGSFKVVFTENESKEILAEADLKL